jgi:hypothetical protein
MKTYTLHYSEQLIRQAVRCFWRRTVGWTYFAALAGLAIILAVLFHGGTRPWWLGSLITGCIVAALMPLTIYVVHYRNSMQSFRRLKSPQGVLEAGENRFRITSDYGAIELPWGAIVEVWRFPELWLLLFSPAQFCTLPLADLDTEGREFILDRLRASGAKIK